MLFCFSNAYIMHATVEPQFFKRPRDFQNLFAIMRFPYIKVLFHILLYYLYWGKENCSLYQGSLYGDSAVVLL